MKIVVLDGFTSNPGDLSWDGLIQLGETKIYDRTNRDQILPRCKNVDIVITNKTKLDGKILKKLPKLKYIGVLATGYDVVDIIYAKERNITVCNVPDYSSSSVAQTVFALIMAHTNRVCEHGQGIVKWSESLDFTYSDYKLIELSGKTIGIIGFGNIGKKVAKIAAAFDMKILVSTRTKPDVLQNDIELVSIEEICRKSDVITLHCPLTDKTSGLINEKSIGLMKKNAIIVNTARGALVNETDLYVALESNKIYGAALDVLTEEPPDKNNALLKAKNAYITPHNAWASYESRQRLIEAVIKNLNSFIKGKPVNIVN